MANYKTQNSHYRKAIELNPDFADAHYNLEIILKDLGKLQDAEVSLRKAIELNPIPISQSITIWESSKYLKDLGKLQEAELSTRKAIELKPDFAEAHYNLGKYLKRINTRKAIELKLKAYSNQRHISRSWQIKRSRISNCKKQLEKS